MLKVEGIPGISIEASTEKKEIVCNLTVELK
jgi:hypothetical protein